jgi:hypothetical protein
MTLLGVKLPQDLLEEEKFDALPAKEKEYYMRAVLLKILELNPNGISAPQIGRVTFFSRPTVWRHLENMVATREAYKLEFGKAVVYYPNGKMIHPLFSEDVVLDDKAYAFFFIKNNFGDFVYIQEKTEDRLGRTAVCGGLILPLTALDKFINRLERAKEEVVNFVTESER